MWKQSDRQKKRHELSIGAVDAGLCEALEQPHIDGDVSHFFMETLGRLDPFCYLPESAEGMDIWRLRRGFRTMTDDKGTIISPRCLFGVGMRRSLDVQLKVAEFITTTFGNPDDYELLFPDVDDDGKEYKFGLMKYGRMFDAEIEQRRSGPRR